MANAAEQRTCELLVPGAFWFIAEPGGHRLGFDPMDFIRHVVLNPHGYLFELWLMLGGLMAAPVCASSVVAMPLLLDRQLNTMQAVLTSWKVVLTHPMPMVLWAFLIMALSMLGILSLFIGLIVIVPMLGHASWHAYRDLVDTRNVPERMPPLEAM